MRSSIIIALLFLFIVLIPACDLYAKEAAQPSANSEDATAEDFDRLDWWRKAKFGMFIHWGVYSQAGGEWNGETNHHEWLQFTAKIPLAEYTEYAKSFNPVDFDADEWVKIAKVAGMKYMVITAKHHDGFAMYNSASSAHNVVKGTAFKRDPIKELADACAKHDLHFCVYYSLGRDWEDPDVPTGGSRGMKAGWRSNLIDFPNESKKDFQKYFDRKVKPQVRELLTNYGPIGVMWFDTSERINKAQSLELIALIRKLQPKCIINSRVGRGLGDYKVEEQKVPSDALGEPWEACMTMNKHWGYNKADQNWRSSKNLVQNLVDIVSKGGNYLLNVGPTGEGVIPQPSVSRLAEMGRWLAIYGEAIYGCGPTPFGEEVGSYSSTEKDKNGKPKFVESWEWRATTKPGKIYIHIFDWKAGPMHLPAITSNITRACLMSDTEQAVLEVQQSDERVVISLPESAPSTIASVVCLELAEK